MAVSESHSSGDIVGLREQHGGGIAMLDDGSWMCVDIRDNDRTEYKGEVKLGEIQLHVRDFQCLFVA